MRCHQPEGAAYYRGLAARLREAYVRQFLSRENGWFVSWISQDGQVHDYCHTFVNGAAVAYGIVGPEQGKADPVARGGQVQVNRLQPMASGRAGQPHSVPQGGHDLARASAWTANR